MIDAMDKLQKAEEIFRKEGTYLKYLGWKRRGANAKIEAMLEDLFNRYGQNLDGDLTFKHKEGEVAKAKTPEGKEVEIKIKNVK